jgi:hypothetical protein
MMDKRKNSGVDQQQEIDYGPVIVKVLRHRGILGKYQTFICKSN